jgi:ATP-dependent RNA helicase SUPV3L1/SUV3
MGFDTANRSRNVTAVLGPTNTGKTHLAIERMLGHESGLIGLPLRLLAREVYDKISQRVGADRVALITGEEKIKPESARYFVCTVEAMPREANVDFLAIDEVQLCADPERGHVFTDRLLHVRGRQETLLLGAQTMREAITDLIPGANFVSRPRLSKLTYAGEKKITRLPPRSAVVAFSAAEVYAIAELIRRQRGGAAVVLGALSPRTRNAQVALYQSGDVDFLVATDAIGMGLNLDVDHVAFAGVRKFDGQVHRQLTAGELAQIAGRAGRHMNDGTFGVTGGVPPLEPDLVERLETHAFDSVKSLQWRARDLDLRTLDRLRDSLRQMPREQRLSRARMADDVIALESLSNDREILDMATTPEAVSRLWDVCQIPDYRKISSQNHAELTGTVYKFIMTGEGCIPEDWFAKQVAFSERTDGDIDTLSNRIAHIRTWTFVSNRVEWLANPAHWQERTRAIEDALSDALHERLTQRFVDRRTSALMRSLKDKDDMVAEIGEDGRIEVEKHFVGRLKGFRFFPDTEAEGIHGKAMRSAAQHVVTRELGMRVRRVVSAKADAFKLTRQGAIIWRDEEIGRLDAGEDPLKPQVSVIADEYLQPADKERVQERLNTWVSEAIGERLKPLVEISNATDVQGLARGIAFRLKESFGALARETVAEEVRSLDQPARAQLRKYGVRFGAFNIYFPLLLKPASADLACTLFLLKNKTALGLDKDDAVWPEPPRPGLTSTLVDPKTPEAFYRVAGFHVCGPRAVRMDMLERLADLIRPLMAWRKPQGEGAETAVAPKGATGDGGFTAVPEMMSILGCSSAELGNVLKSLGFWADRRLVKPEPVGTKPADTAPPVEAAPAQDEKPVETPSEAAPAEPVTAEAAVETPQAVATEAPTPEAAAAPEAEQVAAAPEAEQATAEPAAAAAPAAEAKAGDEKPEEKWIEIWRPRRRGAQGGQSERREGRDAKPGDRQGHGRRHGHHRGRQHDRNRPGQPPAEGTQPQAALADASGAAPQPAAEAAPAPAEPRREHRPHNQNRHAGKGGKPFDRNAQGNGGKGGRPPQRFDRKREDRPRAVMQAGPPQKSGSIDPDSPFAALSQLKAQMEKANSK